MQINKISFENLSITKAFFKLSLPCVISQIIIIIYSFIDTWFVARTNNSDVVSAITVCVPLFVIITGIANLFGIGGSTIIANYLGKKENKKATSAFCFSFWGCLFVASLYFIIIIIFQNKLVFLVGGESNNYAYVKTYLLFAIAFCAIPATINNLLSHLIRSVGETFQAALGLSLGVIINLLLNIIFIFFLFPKGSVVLSVSIATLVANIFSAIYFIIYIRRSKYSDLFSFKPSKEMFMDKIPANILLIGLPSALTVILAMISTIIANIFFRTLGNSALAGLGIARKITTTAFNIFMGITQGIMPFIAYNFGAKKIMRVKKATLLMGGVSFACSIIFFLFFTYNSDKLLRLFVKEDAIVFYGTFFLKALAMSIPLCSIIFSITSFFQAVNQKLLAFLITIIKKGTIDILIMYLILIIFNHDYKLIIYATPLCDFIALLLAVIFLSIYIIKNRKYWKRKNEYYLSS